MKYPAGRFTVHIVNETIMPKTEKQILEISKLAAHNPLPIYEQCVNAATKYEHTHRYTEMEIFAVLMIIMLVAFTIIIICSIM